MTPDEKDLVVGMLQQVLDKSKALAEEAAKQQPAPKASGLDKWNFALSAVVIPIFLAGWAYIKLDIDSTVQTSVSNAKDTYEPLLPYNSDKQTIWKTLSDHETRLDADDVKIGVLQTSAGKSYSEIRSYTNNLVFSSQTNNLNTDP